MDGTVETVSGIAVGEDDRRAAEALVALLRAAAADLPFGLDPQDLLQALERLAPAAEMPEERP